MSCEAVACGELSCEEQYNCCDCGTDDQDNGCGCRYCWSCNACEECLNED